MDYQKETNKIGDLKYKIEVNTRKKKQTTLTARFKMKIPFLTGFFLLKIKFHMAIRKYKKSIPI